MNETQLANIEEALNGRPPKYKHEYCTRLIQHMAKGKAIQSFAGQIGVALSTVYKWFHDYPEFKVAKEIGMQMSFEEWEKIGLDGMWNITTKDGDTVNTSKLNTTNYIFQMKNRFGWKDKVEHELSESIKEKTQINVTQLHESKPN